MITCPEGHQGTFAIRNTIRQSIGVGIIRVNAEGGIVEVIDPAPTRVDLRCDECSKNFSLNLPGGRRELPYATENVSQRTVLDEVRNTPELVTEEVDEEDDD